MATVPSSDSAASASTDPLLYNDCGTGSPKGVRFHLCKGGIGSHLAASMKYRRVLLKLSGEALMGNKQFGIDNQQLALYAHEVEALVKAGVEVIK